MNSPLAAILEGLVRLVDAIMNVFSLLHDAERNASESSLVGESGLEQQVRRRRASMIQCWAWASLLPLAAAAVFKSWLGCPSLPPPGSEMDFRADAAVGEDLQDQGMGNPPVDEMNLADTTTQGGQ